MRKHGGIPSRRDKYVALAAISPPGVARGRFVGAHQSGLAGRKSPPLFMRGASACPSQGRHQGEPWGASPRPSAPTLPDQDSQVLFHHPVLSLAKWVRCVSIWQGCSYLNVESVQNTFVPSCVATDAYIFIRVHLFGC